MKIAVVDDHALFRKSLIHLFESFNVENDRRYIVSVDAANGTDLVRQLGKLPKRNIPDIVLLDLSMPSMNGFETLSWLQANFPLIKVVMLTMKADDASIINCLKLGACCYLLKDIHPPELKIALDSVLEKGYYNADAVTVKVMQHISGKHIPMSSEQPHSAPVLSDKEAAFLQLACSDLTYKQIAAQMDTSERIIDIYRESLFAKLKVKSRVGMALEAIRLGIVTL